MRYLLLLGSNVDREASLAAARRRLSEQLAIDASSAVYESDAIGAPRTPRFHNQALLVDTPLGHGELRTALRAIESDLGRVRTKDPNTPRTIDIDILLGIRPDGLIDASIPIDADLCRYHHSCVPAAELCPDLVLGNGRTLASEAGSLPSIGDGFLRIE